MYLLPQKLSLWHVIVLKPCRLSPSTAQSTAAGSSDLQPQEAPITVAEKRKIFLPFQLLQASRVALEEDCWMQMCQPQVQQLALTVHQGI